MIKKRLSIVDIANKLNISKTTVSFILNGRAKEKRISEELVERVINLLKKLATSQIHWPKVYAPASQTL